MAQLTIYLADEIESQARQAAADRGTSVGKWIAEQVAEKVRNTWHPDVMAALGAFPDFPEESELRLGYGTDSIREPLD